MIPEKIFLKIVTPEREVYAQEVSSARLPGANGYFGVYPGHTPYIAAMKVGQIKTEIDGVETLLATTGGVVEVFSDAISVLAETCESASLIDRKRAEESRDRAKDRIEKGRKSWDVERAQVALARAVNRLSASAR